MVGMRQDAELLKQYDKGKAKTFTEKVSLPVSLEALMSIDEP